MSTRTRGRIPGVALVTFLAIVVIVELWVRSIEPRLPLQPGMWPRSEMAFKYEQMQEVQRSGVHPEVMFAGSSMTASGVDPNAFTRASGVESYNAAFAGPGMRSLSRWVLEIGEPLLGPRTVVLGLQSRELNDELSAIDRFDEVMQSAPGVQLATGRNPIDRMERWLDDVSAFYRNRRALRSPSTLFELKVQERNHTLGPRGARIQEPRFYRDPIPSDRHAAVPFRNPGPLDLTATRGFGIGGEELSSLAETADELNSRRVRLVVMVMPVTLDYEYADPAIRSRLFDALEVVARDHDITVIDAQDAFPTYRPFRDPIHLDTEGRAAFGRALGRAWGEISTTDSDFLRLTCSTRMRCALHELDALEPSDGVTPGRRHGFLCASGHELPFRISCDVLLDPARRKG